MVLARSGMDRADLNSGRDRFGVLLLIFFQHGGGFGRPPHDGMAVFETGFGPHQTCGHAESESSIQPETGPLLT
jgi:hypothetical protein